MVFSFFKFKSWETDDDPWKIQWRDSFYLCFIFYSLQTNRRTNNQNKKTNHSSWRKKMNAKTERERKTNACSYCNRLEVKCLLFYIQINVWDICIKREKFGCCLFRISIGNILMSMLMRNMRIIFFFYIWNRWPRWWCCVIGWCCMRMMIVSATISLTGCISFEFNIGIVERFEIIFFFPFHTTKKFK